MFFMCNHWSSPGNAKDPKHLLRAFLLARVAGFEPAHDGIRIHCLTAWRYPNAYLYCLTCLQMGWIVGFEPTHNGATTRCLNHLTIPTILEATPGFEPGNKGFADLCLTTWLCRRLNIIVFHRVENDSGFFGGGSRIRTYAWWNQNPLPYRLAIPLRQEYKIIF